MSDEVFERRIIEVEAVTDQASARVREFIGDVNALDEALARFGNVNTAGLDRVASILQGQSGAFASAISQGNAYIAMLERANSLGLPSPSTPYAVSSPNQTPFSGYIQSIEVLLHLQLGSGTPQLSAVIGNADDIQKQARALAGTSTFKSNN